MTRIDTGFITIAQVYRWKMDCRNTRASQEANQKDATVVFMEMQVAGPGR